MRWSRAMRPKIGIDFTAARFTAARLGTPAGSKGPAHRVGELIGVLLEGQPERRWQKRLRRKGTKHDVGNV
jgi:hypothetical protein